MFNVFFSFNDDSFSFVLTRRLKKYRQRDLRDTCLKLSNMIHKGYTKTKLFDIQKNSSHPERIKEAMKECGALSLGVYVSTQECERPSSIAQVLDEFSWTEREFFAEVKYDGER